MFSIKCDFQDPVVRVVLNDRRDFGQSGEFGGAKAPLACDELVSQIPFFEPAVAELSHVFL